MLRADQALSAARSSWRSQRGVAHLLHVKRRESLGCRPVPEPADRERDRADAQLSVHPDGTLRARDRMYVMRQVPSLARLRGLHFCGDSGEAVLQAGVAELVNRADGAQNVPLAGVVEEVHKVRGSVPSPGELGRDK